MGRKRWVWREQVLQGLVGLGAGGRGVGISFLKLINFWLHSVFLAGRGLSLLVSERGPSYSWCGAWASHCGGFFCRRAQALARLGFRSCCLRAQ